MEAEAERRRERRRRDVVVKAEKRSPRRSASRSARGSQSPPAEERRGSAGPRQGRSSRSPKRKSKSGRRSRSPRGRRSRSPHHAAVKVKQERDDHCRRGNEERKQRYPSEPEHRRDRSGDRDRHRDHTDRRKNPNERPGVRGHERERDVHNIREQQAEREFYNERRREHRQNNQSSGVEQKPELGQSDNKPKEKPAVKKEKPSFELSGALLEDTNTFRGVVIKYSEPPEARIPKKRWRLYPFKNDEFLPVMYIHRQSAYLLGRHRRIADIPIDHPSCSKQHAVFQYRLVEYTRADGTVGRRVRPYIIDLGSGNGTFLNNQRIEPQRYYELKEKDVLKFGFSSREYVLLHESSDKSEANTKDDDDDDEKEEESDS